MKTHNIIQANQFEDKIAYSEPKHKKDDKENGTRFIISKWIEKQGKHWPTMLTPEVIAKELSLIYLPFTIVSGSGSAQWSASVGQNQSTLKQCGTCGGRGIYRPILADKDQRCPDCGGTGKAIGKQNFWSSQSGFVNANVDHRVQANFDEEFKCGNRDTKAPHIWLSSAEAMNYPVLHPKYTSAQAAQAAAYQTVLNMLTDNARYIAQDMGIVKNLQVVNENIKDIDTWVWLYPLYLGQYQYEAEVLDIQIDGITGGIWADVPTYVEQQRQKETNKLYKNIAISSIIMFVIIFFAHLYLQPHGGDQNAAMVTIIISVVSSCILWVFILPAINELRKRPTSISSEGYAVSTKENSTKQEGKKDISKPKRIRKKAP